MTTDLEAMFLFHFRALAPSYPAPLVNYRFAVPARKFEWDCAWVFDARDGNGAGVAVELQGGIWMRTRSGHSSGAGITRDLVKHNLGVALGWKVLYFSSDMLRRDPAGCVNQVVSLLAPVPIVYAECTEQLVRPRKGNGR